MVGKKRGGEMLKAIDAQQVIMQIEQTGKVQQVHERHPEMQQRYIELQLKEEKKLLQEKVKDAEEANRAMIRDQRERERGKNAENDHREGKGQSMQEEEGEDEAHQGGLINIKV